MTGVADPHRSDAALDAFYAALLTDDAEALYERAPCGYLSTTPDGTIVKVNATFLTWTGWTTDDLVGRRRFVDLLTGGGRIYHETHYATTLQLHGQVREVALDIVTPDGRRLPSLVNSVLDRGEDGTPLVVRTVVFDATERRSYERELLAAKERAEAADARSREVVHALQRTLLPPDLPHIPGLRVDAAFQPAGEGTELGGDFYDTFQVAEHDWLVAVGDVSGKGLAAATVTALARNTILASAVRSPDPCEIVETLNHVLLRHETDHYVTVVIVRLRRRGASWTATICAGGHPLPVLLREGSVRPLGRHGSVVGLFDDLRLEAEESVLQPADTLVLYTDGITEGRRRGELFGDERLHEALARHGSGAAPIAGAILEEALAYQGGRASDDAAVVAVTVIDD